MTVLADRFELGPVIAEGGGGVVHHAWDRLASCAVALKLLHPRGSPVDLLREVKLLADLEHPRIVRYVAHGTTPDGRTFLATEWLEGTTLAALIDRGPLSLDDTLAAVIAATEGLRAAHARGVVHRDVKPSNLFAVAGDPRRLKLIDFGVATARGSLQESERGGLAGTPAYLSPEQARRANVDARSDIFSLGCVLHECLTGRRLFEGSDVPALLRKIQFDPVPRVGDRAPPALEALLARMLSRAPTARPTPDELLAALHALAPSLFASAGSPAAAPMRLTDREERLFTVLMARSLFPDRTPAAWRVLGDGTFLIACCASDDAGRDAREAARLALSLQATTAGLAMAIVAGRGQLVDGLPLGPALEEGARLLERCPAGKIQVGEEASRLLDERFALEEALGTVYLAGERPEADRPRPVLGHQTPFVGRAAELGRLELIFAGALRERAARAVLVTGEAGIGKTRLRQAFCAQLARAGVDLAVARDEGPGGPLAVARALVRALDPAAGVPALADREASADRVRAGWLDWIEARRRLRPLVLMVEDAHAADRPSLELVGAALAHARAHGAYHALLVLGFARPLPADPPVAPWAPPAERIALGPLPPEACATLAAAVLGSAGDPSLIDRATGNPLFLEELLRAGTDGNGELPGSIAALVQARIDRVPAGPRRVLRVASVLGATFDALALAALLPERDEAALVAPLAALAAEELLVPLPGGRHAFRHAIVAEAALASLTDGDRALGHRLAAAWLARQPDADAAEVARHFDRAGDRAHAGPWYGRAAARALQVNDLEQALALADQAGQCGLPPAELGAVKIVEARAHFWRAEYLESELAAKRALRAAAPGSLLWFRALGDLCQALGERGEYAEIERQVGRAEAQAPAPGAEASRRGGLLRAIGYLAVSSRRATARRLLEGWPPSFDVDESARLHSCRALLAAAEGRTFVASEETRAALALYERAGDLRRRCEMAADLGSAAIELGDLDGGIDRLRGVVDEATRLGAARIATAAQVNLVQGLAWRGRFAEAAALGRGAVDEAREQGNRRLEAGALAFLAEAALLENQPDEGERLARRALARAEGVEALRPALLAVLAWALLGRGDAAAAVTHSGEAMVLFEREGRPEINEWLLWRVRAEALVAAGDGEGGRQAVATALDRLRARASDIPEGPMRAKFLSLPHQTRILSLAR